MLRRHLLPVPLLLLSGLSLAGCGAVQAAATLVPRAPLPSAAWQCQPEPTPPIDGSDDAAFASWIADLADAGQSCRDALKTAHDIVEGETP